MGRIRSIKPEFPQSESIGRLSRDARLLFVQLWTIVDDDGRVRAASRMLASLLYPYDDDAKDLIGGWLDELAGAEIVRLYTVTGSQYLEIINWKKHQKIDKPSKSKLPAFEEGSPTSRDNSEKPRECSTTDMDLGGGYGRGSSEAYASATGEPVGEDPKAKLFRVGKTILASFGIAERRTGSLIGQWLKARPDPLGLLAALQYARDQNVAEPVAYVSALVHGKQINGEANGHRDPLDRRPGESLGDLGRRLAAEARDLERAAGVGRPDDAFGEH